MNRNPISAIEGEAPDGPHIAYLKDQATGLAEPLPVGSVWILVPDPKAVHTAVRMILAKVAPRQLVFKCFCNNPRCTKVYKWDRKEEGTH